MIEQPPFWMWIAGFLLVLGPLVTLHELGHYLVGRWFGVGAKAFSVGFGKELAGFTDSRGTRWKLSALPLGGYVQFKGDMNPASIPVRNTGERSSERAGDATFGVATEDALEEEEDRAVVGAGFHRAALWKRALIVFAGPAMNLLIALAVFAGIFMTIGRPVAVDPEQQLTVAGFSEESPAREAGIRVGDRIVSLDGEPLESFRDLQTTIMLHPGRNVELGVLRDGRERTIAVTADSREIEDRFGNVSRIGLLGISSAAVEYEFERQGPLAAAAGGVEQSIDTFDMMITGLGQIVTGRRSVQELGGPVKIAKFSGEQLSLGWISFVNFVALISLNLAFINLLPIPALDGGHLAFYAAEAIRRRPVGPRATEMAYRTGVALVLALMLFVTINDVVTLVPWG